MVDQLVPTKLWKHQQEEVSRFEDQPRVLIGWEMGTGKTLAAVERDLRLRRDAPDVVGTSSTGGRPTLVVAPLNTHSSWRDTFEGNTDLRVRVIDRKNRELFIANNDRILSNRTVPIGHADVYIMHYDVLRLMPELVGKFGHGIFDECHKLKNRNTKQTKAAKHLGIPFLTDMSGTPVTDRPQDFWSVLNHLKPKTFSSYWKFFHKYVNYWKDEQGYFHIVGPAPDWTKEGLPGIRQFYSRVLKDDVLDLPPKTYKRLEVELTPQQRRKYDDMKKTMIAWLENVHKKDGNERPLPAAAVVSQLQRLQMFALGNAYLNDVGKVVLDEPSSKCDALMDEMEDNPSEQFVVFTQFKGPLRILKERFRKANITYGSFTGDDNPKVREAHKQGFIRGDRRVLLATIGSGGVGVDGLQHACCTAVFLDRDWSPAVNSQAEDRLHRGGQTRTVQVIDIIARDTVDLGRHQKLELKAQMIKEMLGDT